MEVGGGSGGPEGPSQCTMAGNPKGSKWRSPPEGARHSVRIVLRVDERVRRALERLADGAPLSEAASKLILAEYVARFGALPPDE